MSEYLLKAKIHKTLSAVLSPGDITIDATVGNGHDTLFLARQVGALGKVYGFDIQQQAIDNTYQRLDEAGEATPVSLYHAGHEVMAMVLPGSAADQVKVVMFDLGALPGGDRSRTTGVSTTLAALQTSLSLLGTGGVLSVLSCAGCSGEREEVELVKAWTASLPEDLFKVSAEVSSSGLGRVSEWILVRRR